MDKHILANGQELDLTPLLALQSTISAALARTVALTRGAVEGVQALDALQAVGVDFARPVYQGEYLYRALPSDGGKRRREYVGGVGEKTAAALALMERGAKYTEQVTALRALVRQVKLAQRPAGRLLDYLEALKPQ